MVRRVMLLVLASVVITLLMTTMAFSSANVPAAPADIYNDWADGSLDGYINGVRVPSWQYVATDYERFLNDSTYGQYGVLWGLTTGDVTQDMSTDVDRSTFPFTGFQLMLAGIVVVVLVGGGVALRLLSRPQKS